MQATSVTSTSTSFYPKLFKPPATGVCRRTDQRCTCTYRLSGRFSLVLGNLLNRALNLQQIDCLAPQSHWRRGQDGLHFGEFFRVARDEVEFFRCHGFLTWWWCLEAGAIILPDTAACKFSTEGETEDTRDTFTLFISKNKGRREARQECTSISGDILWLRSVGRCMISLMQLR